MTLNNNNNNCNNKNNKNNSKINNDNNNSNNNNINKNGDLVLPSNLKQLKELNIKLDNKKY